MGKGAERRPSPRIGLLVVLMAAAHALSAQAILQRRVTVHAESVRLSTALGLIAKEGGFRLSYNAAVVPADSTVTLHAVDQQVGEALDRLLPGRLRWKESGGHLIITGPSGRKQRFPAAGSVFDRLSGGAIARATVLEARRSNAVATDDRGRFTITLSGELERTPLVVSRHGYRDTVVFVALGMPAGRIGLQPIDGLRRIEPICAFDRCGVEDLGMTRLLVPAARMDQAANLAYAERRVAQISLIPTVGTNGPISGAVINRLSFNVLGGYARGVEGVEIGGGLNLLSHDLSGLQVGGLANLVGGRVEGAQVAGAINHSMRSLEGLQLAGLGNTVWDTLTGVQVAGGVNVVKRGMTGTQIAGAANVALGDLNGVQVSGGVNAATGAVNRTQVSGAVNLARSVKGAQVSGGVNVALGEVGGGQVGFAANVAQRVTGGQVSFGVNAAPGEVSGGQVGFALNYAGSVTGGQFSFGANVVPGSVSKGQVGFALNYAGNVTGGQFSFGLNVVPGTVHGGQVGAVNVGRRVHGGQVGFINLSDSLSGGAVGLLTFSLKGYHRIDAITGDALPLSIQLRTGTRVFHNIIGYSPAVSADGRWSFLYGFGFEPRFGQRFFANIDLTAEQVVEQRAWVDAVNILGRFSLAPGVRFADRVVLFAGPVVNLLVTDWRDADTGTHLSALPPGQPPYQRRSGTILVNGWWGWKAGAGVMF